MAAVRLVGCDTGLASKSAFCDDREATPSRNIKASIMECSIDPECGEAERSAIRASYNSL
jgi:hypothetical protein